MKAYLDHIGIGVLKNSPLAKLLATLGLIVKGTEVIEREQVTVEKIPLSPTKSWLELLQGTEEDSVVSKFLKKTGKDAFHHLCLRVEDLEEATHKLRQAGFELIYEKPKKGAGGCKVNFIHPKTTGGLLIELSQK